MAKSGGTPAPRPKAPPKDQFQQHLQAAFHHLGKASLLQASAAESLKALPRALHGSPAHLQLERVVAVQIVDGMDLIGPYIGYHRLRVDAAEKRPQKKGRSK